MNLFTNDCKIKSQPRFLRSPAVEKGKSEQGKCHVGDHACLLTKCLLNYNFFPIWSCIALRATVASHHPQDRKLSPTISLMQTIIATIFLMGSSTFGHIWLYIETFLVDAKPTANQNASQASFLETLRALVFHWRNVPQRWRIAIILSTLQRCEE